MAGTDARFDSAAFRDAIRFAMTMGLPNATDERATFIWDTERTFNREDSAGNPLTWNETPATTVSFPEVQIPVAVEFFSKGGDSQKTRIGEFDSTRCTITMLDEDYAEIFVGDVRANRVRLKDAEYRIQFEAPPLGLFDVTVYQLICVAIDEV